MYEIIHDIFLKKNLRFLFHGEYHVEHVKYELSITIQNLSLRDYQ